MALAEDTAGDHFTRGVEFSKEHDYVAAMVEFKKAYELDPRYPVLFNIGQTSNELKDYAGALSSYERYLKDGGEEIDADRRKKVQALIEELTRKVASISIATNVAGVSVIVDDVDVGVTPLPSSVRMNAGRRKLVLTKSGYEPVTRIVEIAGTEEKTLSFELVSLTQQPSGTGNTGSGGDGTAPQQLEHTVWPWVGLASTGALAVATGVFGGLALSKHGAFEDALTVTPTTNDAIESARSDAKTFALVTDILLGTTIAAGALTALAFGLDYGRSTTETTAFIRPVVGPGMVGLNGAF
jgi:tetratricopeptide (TPR) repeat protein